MGDGDLAIIDPGDEAERIAATIAETRATPRFILLTHAHLDHVGAAQALKARYGIPLWAPRGEQELLAQLPLQCALFGLPPLEVPSVERWLDAGATLTLGNSHIETRATPGHSPGGVAYLVDNDMFVGDTIFAGSVGRTDLWGGSWPTLQHSIETQIVSWHDDVVLYPGHGPTSSVGVERRQNPFFN